MRLAYSLGMGALFATSASAQAPDLLNAFDAGGRSMGMGGSLYVTEASTLSSYYNPAGLAYLGRREVSASYRNLPRSVSVVTGTLDEPGYDTRAIRGGMGLTHLGYAAPVAEIFGRGPGTIGVAYTVGGTLDDLAVGTPAGVPAGGGAFTVQNYRRQATARADFFTLGWGRTNAAQNLAYGVALAYVRQRIVFRESGNAADETGSPIPFGTDAASTGSGVGAIFGLQYVPPNTPNMNWGLSYRTEINLGGNGQTAGLYDRVPARLLLGAAYRLDNLRGGRDFAVVGAQLQTLFGSGGAGYFARRTQTTFGVGIEYDYTRESFRIPLRVGYVAVPSGGASFASRNEFTYGLGYRPRDDRYWIDFNWGAPKGGGYDFGISAGYRFR